MALCNMHVYTVYGIYVNIYVYDTDTKKSVCIYICVRMYTLLCSNLPPGPTN